MNWTFNLVLLAFFIYGCAGSKPVADQAPEAAPAAVAGGDQQKCESEEDYKAGKCCGLDDKVEKTCYYACKKAEGSKTGEQSPMSMCECWRTAVRECSPGYPKDFSFNFSVCEPGKDPDCPPGWYGQ